MSQYTFHLVELGEGFFGEYNPDDPSDIELLRMDILGPDEIEDSACTNLPVTLDPVRRQRAVAMMRDLAMANPDTSAKKLAQAASWLDPTMVEAGLWDGCVELLFLNRPLTSSMGSREVHI